MIDKIENNEIEFGFGMCGIVMLTWTLWLNCINDAIDFRFSLQKIMLMANFGLRPYVPLNNLVPSGHWGIPLGLQPKRSTKMTT